MPSDALEPGESGSPGGVEIGYGVLHQVVGVPSFVFSLAGLLALQGALLYTLGDTGTITLPQDSALRSFARDDFLSDAQAYSLVALAVITTVVSQVLGIRRRRQAGLTPPSLAGVLVKAVLLGGGLAYFCYYLGLARGGGYLFTFFVLLVVVMDLLLRKIRWGRHVMAVGGNEEASRRAGIPVRFTYYSIFALCSGLAALGGLLLAGQLTTVSQSRHTVSTRAHFSDRQDLGEALRASDWRDTMPG